MLTLAEFGVLQYDSLFAPQNFWRDYDAMPRDAQHDADGYIALDELFGCWRPPPRDDTPVAPVVDAPPQWTEQVVVDTPWTPPPITPPAVPEPATWALLALGALALKRRFA